LRVVDVWKRFDAIDRRNPWILQELSLSFTAGSFTCVRGASGSGKSTLLNLLAGFEKPTRGLIALDDQPVTGAGPDRAVIFQDVGNALFPWLSARENVEFGPRLRGVPRNECRERALKYLGLVGLRHDAEKFPYQLSGGMKQRVQIARSLANEPAILLMDEPFGALDAITRRDLQTELTRVWKETGTTIVFVTHDLLEALLLGTRVIVLGAGKGSILVDFVLDLPAPRSPSQPTFMAIYEKLERVLEQEIQRRQADRASLPDQP
jgi:NitT/TauT family transport system ATP-binding protein